MTDRDSSDRAPTVAEIMRPDAPTVPPDATIGAVAQLMAETGTPGVPVVEGGVIIGIVTEADLVARQADISVPTLVPFLDAIFVADAGSDFDDDLRHVLALTARDLMTAPVYTIRDSATLEQVATLMVQQRVNPVPVVNDDLVLIGLVSRADLVRVIARLEGVG